MSFSSWSFSSRRVVMCWEGAERITRKQLKRGSCGPHTASREVLSATHVSSSCLFGQSRQAPGKDRIAAPGRAPNRSQFGEQKHITYLAVAIVNVYMTRP